ncbi:MAG TPA: hypothetical protein ENK33_11810 [Desulfobacterales bacterium]|nr:hypothetical protein [Desulfobacterales bacterium]
MSFLFRTKKQYVYCGDTCSSMLAEVVKAGDGKLTFGKIAMEDGLPTDLEVLRRLILQLSPTSAGEVSIAFPLHLFEVLSLSLPLLPEHAVARTLPYHIGKAIDKPLSKYIYDWQINKRLKDKMQITVYLFPADLYNRLQKQFSDYHLDVTFFEADAFSAFAYLDLLGIINNNEAALCTIIWPGGLTLGVCEKGKIRLARSVNLIKIKDDKKAEGNNLVAAASGQVDKTEKMPAVPVHEDIDNILRMETDKRPLANSESTNIDNDADSMSILSGFDLIASDSTEGSGDEVPSKIFTEENEGADSLLTPETTESFELEINSIPAMQDYLKAISAEIIRTRDYFSAVMKGGQISSYNVIGAGDLFDQLRQHIMETMGEELTEVAGAPAESNDPGLYIIGLGAGTRW